MTKKGIIGEIETLEFRERSNFKKVPGYVVIYEGKDIGDIFFDFSVKHAFIVFFNWGPDSDAIYWCLGGEAEEIIEVILPQILKKARELEKECGL